MCAKGSSSFVRRLDGSINFVGFSRGCGLGLFKSVDPGGASAAAGPSSPVFRKSKNGEGLRSKIACSFKNCGGGKTDVSPDGVLQFEEKITPVEEREDV